MGQGLDKARDRKEKIDRKKGLYGIRTERNIWLYVDLIRIKTNQQRKTKTDSTRTRFLRAKN